jgi:hypothetical protein
MLAWVSVQKTEQLVHALAEIDSLSLASSDNRATQG